MKRDVGNGGKLPTGCWRLINLGLALTALFALAACGGPPKAVPVAPLPNYVPHGTATAVSPATSAATPVETPVPPLSGAPPRVSDQRFGIVLDALQPDAAGHALQLLHVQWFVGAATGPLDHAATQVQDVPASLTQLATLARRYPGRVWSLAEEPNGISATDPEAQPAAYAARLHAIATALHAADPTAQLIGPDVLDWSTGCTGCGGMVTGQAWTDAMRQAYLDAYHEEVPFDVWSIHTYPLDWQHLPTVNYREMEQQLIDLRRWLDSIPDLRNKPIWDTELGVHWGYTAYQFAQEGGKTTLMPAGILRTDLVENYLRQLLTWLVEKGPAYRIERWFVFAAYNPDVPGDHAGAISLLNGPGPEARLTGFGQIFVDVRTGE